MIRTQTSLVLKYCQALDRFIRVRRFGLQDIDALLNGASVRDRRSYMDLVVNASVVEPENLFRGQPRDIGRPFDEIREELYMLSVEVNPELEITRVTVPVGNEEEGGLALIESPEKASKGYDGRTICGLEEALRRRIVGQDEAVRLVAEAVMRSKAGIRDESRPVGVFLFVGPTGVGKTELAKVLAETVYGDGAHLLRVDCSEYSMGHEYAKLIGAPPGYVGHENGGVLTESMLKMKEGVVLFDEVEKAHEKVHNLLLQLMDEGIITDGKGVKVDFTGSIIIMTSNLGVKEIRGILRRAGFGKAREEGEETLDERRRASIEAVREFFSPEFVNRVDEVVVFNPLDGEAAEKVLELVLSGLSARLERRGVELAVTEKLRKSLIEAGVSRRYGARPLKRIVRRRLEAPIAELLLRCKEPRGRRLKAGLKRDGEVKLTLSASGG